MFNIKTKNIFLTPAHYIEPFKVIIILFHNEKENKNILVINRWCTKLHLK